jgi:uncharacterized protein YciI
MYYVLRYELVRDYLERRAPLRAEHLELARAAVSRGELRLGGALAEPADTALLVFTGDDPSAAEAFARADPYVREGLVVRWTVRPWTVVVGVDAITAPESRPR